MARGINRDGNTGRWDGEKVNSSSQGSKGDVSSGSRERKKQMVISGGDRWIQVYTKRMNNKSEREHTEEKKKRKARIKEKRPKGEESC